MPDIGPEETQLDKAYHYIKSRSAAQRRQDREGANVQRLQATTRGKGGIKIKGNTVGMNQLTIQQPAGVADPTEIPVIVTGCLNGAAAFGLAYYQSPPQAL